MKPYRLPLLLAAFCAAINLNSATPATAAPTKNTASMGMVTGSATGTYIKIGGDIAKISANQNLTISVKESNGSIDNIKRISSDENAALGIVQSDVLGYLYRSQNPESVRVAKNLRMVFPFFEEEVHVLARNDIEKFTDLKGKRVVVGSQGSGSWLTAVNLLSMTETRPDRLMRLSPTEGVMAVLKDKADAIIFVGGKPVKLFKNLEDLAGMKDDNYKGLVENVHFVPMVDERILKEYTASEITSKDYAFVKKAVPTVSVTAMLVSYNFADQDNLYAQERCNDIGTITKAIRSNINYLQSAGHPKWREVNLDRTVAGPWERDPCSASADTNVVAEQAPQDPLEKELLSTVTDRW